MDSELLLNLPDIEKLIESFAYLNSYEELIDNIKKQIDIVAKNDTTGLYLFSREENKLKLFYAKGFSEQEKNEAELTAMDRHPGHVFSTGNILLVDDQDKESNPFSIDSKKKSHTRSRMYVPVRAKNLIIGAFGIQSEKPNAFTEEQLALFKVFAALAGNAYLSIENNLIVKKQNEENEKLSFLAKSTTNNVIFCDKDGKITWVNKHFEESTGYFLDEIKGKTPGSFLIGKDTDPEKTNELRTAILNKKACNTNILNYKKNGEPYIVAIKLSPVFNETGDVLNFVSTQEDITEVEKQKDTINHKNEQLKLREEQYNNIVNNSSDFIISLDTGGQIKFANKSWLQKMNYQLNEVIDTNIFTYIHPDSQEHCMLIFNNIHNTESKSFLIQYNLINKNREKIEVEGEVVLTYKDDVIHSINSNLKDVTEINKLRIEKANKIEELKESKVSLENVLGSLSESIWGLSLPSYKLEYISQSAVALYGYPLQDWYDNVNLWSDLIHPEDKEFVLKENEKLFDVGQVISEYRIITADKKEKWIHSETKVITNEKGIPILMTGITRDITLKKAALIALQENNEKLENVLGSLSETIWGIALPSYKLEYISQSAVALYGYPLQDWYDNVNLWVNLIHPDDKEFVLKENEKLFSDGKVHLEYRIIAADKKVKYLAVNTKVVNNNEGKPILLTGIAEDITAKKLAEIELLNYKNAIDRSAIVSITDVKGNITFVNEKFCEISKYSKEELLGENHRKINSGFHPPEFFKDMWKDILAGKIWKGEIQNKAKDGSIYFVQSSIIPFMKDGKPYQFVAIRYESTEKVVAKLAIEEQKQFYETILNNIPGNVAVFDIKGNYIFINPNTVKDATLRKWLIGKNNYDYCTYRGLSMDLAIERDNQFKLLRENGKAISTVEKRQTNEGQTAYTNSNLILHEYKGEKLMIAYAIDITELKNAEAKVSELKLFYENILNNIPIDIAVFDNQHRYLFINKEAVKDDEIRTWLIGKDDFDYARLKGIATDNAQLRRNQFNYVMKTDSRAIWLDEQVNSSGETKYKERRFHSYDNQKFIVGYAVDVTVLKENEKENEKITEEIIQRNKDLEQFSYIVSHNLRLPVANIMGFADILNNDKLEDLQRSQFQNALFQSTKKLDEVIVDLNNILQIRRDINEKREIVVFSNLIDNIITSIQDIIMRDNVKVIFNFEAITEFYSIKSYLHSIFYNLISNSIKYKQKNIPLIIEIHSSLHKNKLVLSVKDNGSGIDLIKNKDLVFGLYKRFHNQIEGKGMGLYMVKTQVETLGGKITVESGINIGTEFIIEFQLNN